jgi:hypothetical protein
MSVIAEGINQTLEFLNFKVTAPVSAREPITGKKLYDHVVTKDLNEAKEAVSNYLKSNKHDYAVVNKVSRILDNNNVESGTPAYVGRYTEKVMWFRKDGAEHYKFLDPETFIFNQTVEDNSNAESTNSLD